MAVVDWAGLRVVEKCSPAKATWPSDSTKPFVKLDGRATERTGTRTCGSEKPKRSRARQGVVMLILTVSAKPAGTDFQSTERKTRLSGKLPPTVPLDWESLIQGWKGEAFQAHYLMPREKMSK